MLFSVLTLLTLSTNVCSGVQLFVTRGDDVTLDLPDPEPIENYDSLHWSSNRGIALALRSEQGCAVYDSDKCVGVFPPNLSLLLKNVQLSDSGIYTAIVSRKTDVIVSEYDVIVQAPVSPVLLRVDSVSNSPESCNFTVSCTTDLLSISRSFTCDRRTCEEASPAPSGPAHFGYFSLSLYLSNSSITCNYSNKISWTEDAKDIEQVLEIIFIPTSSIYFYVM
uniref:Immunoglobulin subtype domain-containing protein n=1 Tax=Neogobius melanostomus TaxID=47308 RepID=A0A8C6SE71_9GOBI